MNGFRINHNISAMHTYRQLNKNKFDIELRLERLSSGLRINRAADDTAGLAISQRMRAEIRGLQQASANTSQSINLIQTAEGGLNEIHSLLTRMRELAVQSSSDNVTDTDRANIDNEFDQLRSEVDRIATSTEYNSIKLLNGSFTGNSVSYTSSGTSQTLTTSGVQDIVLSGATTGAYTFVDSASDGALTLGNGTVTQTVTYTNAPATGQTISVNFNQLGISLTLNDAYDDADLNNATFVVEAGTGGEFQVGADNASDNQLSFSIGDAQSSGLGLSAADLSSLTNARSAIDSLDTAIDTINTERGSLGAMQSRMEFTISNLDHIAQNVQASESTIRDADFAAEVFLFTKDQILVQAATAMLAQANTSTQSVLGLLQG